MVTNPNDSAFNRTHTSERQGEYQNGITKREYFAGLAISRVITDTRLPEFFNQEQLQTCAKACIRLADALIAELNK